MFTLLKVNAIPELKPVKEAVSKIIYNAYYKTEDLL